MTTINDPRAVLQVLAASASTPTLVTEVRWGWNWPAWATALLAAGAIAWIVTLYAREQRYVSRRRRTLLALLRLAAVGVVMVMLAQPTIERQRVARPRLVLLLDRSASMATRDVAAADLAAAAGAVASQDGKISRREAWEQLVTAGADPLVDELPSEYDVTVVLFDAEHERVESAPETPLGELLRQPEVAGEDASHRGGTRLGHAIDAALRELGGPRPAAVIVMTDGIETGGLPLGEAAARARTLGVPIYAVALGSDRPRPDVALDDVLVEEVVFPGDRLQIEASVRAVGYDGQSARVVLKEAASDRVLSETIVDLPAKGTLQSVRLALRPTEAGALKFEMVVDPLPGEEDVANNRAELTVDVRAEPIRALLVDSTPSYEYRALKSLLERDPAVDLRVRLQDADADYASVDEAAVRDFPVSLGELLEYDVVLLGDVDPDLLPRQAWANLLEFVSTHGGGLAVIAGERFMPYAYRDVSALRVLLPIDLADANALRSSQESITGFAIQPTPAGVRDLSLQLGETPDESAAIWNALPPIFWLLEAAHTKPGVEVLAEHPLRSDAGGQPLPVVLRHYVGAGEVLMHATDETWRWRRQSDDRYFARYWGQVVRRLARGRAMRGRGSLSTDRPEYAVGEAVSMRARLRPTTRADREAVSVLLESGNSPTREVRLPQKGSGADTFEAVLRDLPPDRYTARLNIQSDGQTAFSTTFVIAAPPGEMVQLLVNTTGLADAAEITGGQLYNAKTARRLRDELPPARPTAVEQLPDEPLWNSHWLLLALCGVLGAEWLLRRRAGML